MKISGYIAINQVTNEVLVPKDLKDAYFGWLFSSLEEVQTYLKTEKVAIEDYIIHTIADGFYTVDVALKKME